VYADWSKRDVGQWRVYDIHSGQRGSSGQYWQVGSPAWEKRCDEAFDALATHRAHLPWIHMLRGLAQGGKRWPFASADSVNVARNFKNGNGRCPERMAREIDSIQTPLHWDLRAEDQLELLSWA